MILMNPLFVGWLIFMVVFFAVVVVSMEAGIRRSFRRQEEQRREDERKMFEARLRGELYIPQPAPSSY